MFSNGTLSDFTIIVKSDKVPLVVSFIYRSPKFNTPYCIPHANLYLEPILYLAYPFVWPIVHYAISWACPNNN